MEDYTTKEQLLAGEPKEMQEQSQSAGLRSEEMQSALTKYDKLLESVPDAMLFVNKDAKIVFANEQLEKLFGYSREELAGNDLLLLIPERYRERHRRNVANYFSAPRARPMGTGLQIYGRKKDGTEFPADISLSPFEAEGELLAMAAIRDITERKRAELRIEENYQIQRAISSVLKISLEPISLDEQLERVLDLILTVPGLAPETRGYIYLAGNEPEALVLRASRTISGSKLPPCERISFGECMCGEATPGCEVVFTDCLYERREIQYSGRFPYGHYCVPIVSGEQTLGLINLIVDEGHEKTPEEEEFLIAVANTLAAVIVRHQVEMEKNALKEKLAESEKIAALGRFTANVAHDIRNPLTAVGGFARRLDKKLPGGSKEKEYAEFIASEVSRLESILRNVLSFSRGARLRLEECNLHEIVDEALRLFEEECGERSITIERSFGDIPLIEGDRERILEAIENLISNAIDAMPLGGVLTVVSGEETIEGVQYAVIEVSDTGEGIKEENLSSIFEPFFSTKVASRGAGLGLSITKKIVEDHAGMVLVKSEVGAGSSFLLYFPYEKERYSRPLRQETPMPSCR